MKNPFLKASVISMLSILFAGIAYADQASYQRPPQEFTIKITTTDPNQGVPIEGSVMTFDDKGSHLTQIHNVSTPMQVEIKGTFIGLTVKGSEDYPNIKVVMEMKKSDKDPNPIQLVGSGHAVFGSEDAYTQYITTSE